ncbi:hypothetical protein ANRL1_01623 [Anaerolineae bacterium]|nr:hypothetical protein ANRL1_01623 [Anaerolineae bacterium]
MKRAIVLAGFLLVIPSFAFSGENREDFGPDEAGPLTYRASSSAVILEPPRGLRLKEIVTSEGKRLLAVHEIEDEQSGRDCFGELEPEDMEHLR